MAYVMDIPPLKIDICSIQSGRLKKSCIPRYGIAVARIYIDLLYLTEGRIRKQWTVPEIDVACRVILNDRSHIRIGGEKKIGDAVLVLSFNRKIIFFYIQSAFSRFYVEYTGMIVIMDGKKHKKQAGCDKGRQTEAYEYVFFSDQIHKQYQTDNSISQRFLCRKDAGDLLDKSFSSVYN